MCTHDSFWSIVISRECNWFSKRMVTKTYPNVNLTCTWCTLFETNEALASDSRRKNHPHENRANVVPKSAEGNGIPHHFHSQSPGKLPHMAVKNKTMTLSQEQALNSQMVLWVSRYRMKNEIHRIARWNAWNLREPGKMYYLFLRKWKDFEHHGHQRNALVWYRYQH